MYDNPYSRKGIYIQTTDDTKIKLQAKGTTLLFTSKTPTQYKLDTCQHVELTSEVEWNPHKVTFPCSSCKEEEDHLHSLSSTGVSCIVTLANLSVLDDVSERKTFISDERKTDITPSSFSKHWQIGPKQAAQTLRVTTQRGVRSAILPLA